MLRIMFLTFLCSLKLFSQLDCDVTVNLTQVPQYQDQLQQFEQDIENYIASQRWTNDDLGGEKIKCSMTIFFVSGSTDNSYQAQAFIGSQRPVYIGKKPSSKSSSMVRIFDDKWEFTYIKGQPLYKNDNQFDPLTDFIDFYMYLILGYDYDSYDMMTGTPFFQKCYTFINQAPSSAKGWERGTSSSYTKYQLVDEVLNPKNQPMREGWYQYHFNGLDLLATKKEKGLQSIVDFLKNIVELKRTSNPRAQIFKAFFDVKYGELAEVLKDYPDRSIYKLLMGLDQGHQSTYEEALRSLEQ